MAKWGEGDPRWIVEERPDATNVNNWHWSEKNACQWSQTKLKELFKDLKVENSEGSCQVSEVSKCEGEAVVNNRKGRLIFFYEWSIELKWKATSTKADPKPLEASGRVSIPNMSEENDVKEVEVRPLMPNPFIDQSHPISIPS
ncbi:hypothetical protein B566_EDAN017628 [Ephemera danica]|nr:hypothetical protein B566_EDAN017628 [Ephemera danica]